METEEPKVVLSIEGLNPYCAMPCNRDMSWQTTMSLVEMTDALARRGMEFKFQMLTQGSQIDRDRSELAKLFLESDCDKLFWIDSDMRFSPDAFLRILALSTVMPIVGASYPAKKHGSTEFLVAMDKTELEANEYGCFEVHGYGLGFCCIQREVMEKCAEVSPTFLDNGKPLKMIFRTGIDFEDGVYRSEDMHFFKLCRSLGYKVMLDPMIELGHIGCEEHRGKLIDAVQPVNGKQVMNTKGEPCLL